MTTPAHAVVNLVLLGRGRGRADWIAVLVGAVLPDAPMFLFYAVQRGLFGTPEQTIWQISYFQAHWQDFFDVFNSIPLIVALGLIGWWRDVRWLFVGALSMGLHVLLDLPLHHDDGHRHFFPLWNWRFESPVSYWDPAHYGYLAAPIEGLFVLVGTSMLWKRYPARGARVVIGAVAGLYVAYLMFAVAFWLEG